MLVLAIETSLTQSGEIGLFTSSSVCLGTARLPEGRSQGEHLAPAIVDLLSQHHQSIDDLKAIAVSVGPGSFTGLRIAIATAQGIAFARKIPIVGASTLANIALTIPSTPSSRYVAPVIDAYKGEIFTGLFDRSQSLPTLIGIEVNIKPEHFPTWIAEHVPNDATCSIVGERIEKYEALWKNIPRTTRIFEKTHPNIRNVAQLAWPKLSAAAWQDAKYVLPIYLRPVENEFKTTSV